MTLFLMRTLLYVFISSELENVKIIPSIGANYILCINDNFIIILLLYSLGCRV